MSSLMLRMNVNGKPYADGAPAEVYPGRPNLLTISGAGEGRLVVEIRYPAGGGRQEQAALKLGAAAIDLGPLAAPAVYEFNCGMVFRLSYRFHILLEDAKGTVRAEWRLYQGLTRDAQAEWLLPGNLDSVRYNDGYIAEKPNKWERIWKPFTYSGGPMDPAVHLRLDPAVLRDPDELKVEFSLRKDPPVGTSLAGLLSVTDAGGKPVIDERPVEILPASQSLPLPCRDWPEGNYTIRLRPILGSRAYDDGPAVTYRRRKRPWEELPLSPLAPYWLKRDSFRAEKTLEGLPVYGRIQPNLTGWYAVFATIDGISAVRIDGNSLLYRIHSSAERRLGETFVTADDLTGKGIEIVDDEAVTGKPNLIALHFVPVTAESAANLRQKLINPPHPLWGICDFGDYWSAPNLGARERWSHDGREIDRILQGQREVGISNICWAVGRTWVNYHSKLPDATYFTTGMTEDDARRHPHLVAWRHAFQSMDPWREALRAKAGQDVKLHGWLCMNRHYDPKTWWQSQWAKSHEAWKQRGKDGREGHGGSERMEYFFPGVRKERLDILREVAEPGPDGIVVGCCRQPPMAGYNTTMCEEYLRQTGRDPRKLAAGDGDHWRHWLQWRADFFTELMRELRGQMRGLESRLGRPMPVVARVPDEGPDWNLACGMDVRTWVQEGLIDVLLLDPLEDSIGQAPHDPRPYLELCRGTGIRVLAGVNGTTGAFGQFEQQNPVAGLRRAMAVLATGIDGLEIYESNSFAWCTHERWLVPLWADPQAAGQFLKESNIEAVWPLTARTALLGHDNHWIYGFTPHGAGNEPLPRGATGRI